MEQPILEPPTSLDSSEAYQFHLEDFDGPLDLLLFLIKKNELNIYDIPISEITEQYLAYLNTGNKIDLEHLTDFYVMASTLIYLKSRMLLPIEVDLDDELEDPRKDLVQKLIEYQKFKKLTQLMQEKEEAAEWYLERKKMQHAFEFGETKDMWEDVEVSDLLMTFAKVMGNLSAERVLSLYEEVSVNEKIALIHEFIDTKVEFSFEDLITRPGSAMDVVCAFLAVLECVKIRLITVQQHRMLGEIRLRARPRIGLDPVIGDEDIL